MALSSSLSEDGITLTIQLDKKFDFGAHQAFREQYDGHVDSVRHYIVDFESTVYIDSSALGMLLLLRDHAGAEASDIKLVNASESIRKILDISNFDQLFTIE